MQNKTRKNNNKTNKTNKTKKKRCVLKIDSKLLKKLTSLHTPTGEEEKAVDFLLEYIEKNKSSWKHTPKVIHNEETRNNIVVVFGNPKTAIMSHIDSIGFMHTGTKKTMLNIGGVVYVNNAKIRGYTRNNKKIETKLKVKNNKAFSLHNNIPPGTNFTYVPKWKETRQLIKSTNLDDKLGVYVCLELAKTLKNGILIFTCGEEEPMAGDIPYLTELIYKDYGVKNVLVLDVTPDTNNIDLGKGTVIAYRDQYIYKRAFINKILDILNSRHVQLEVGYDGSSDGEYILMSPYPMNVIFLGIPVQKLHTNYEVINKRDVCTTLNNVKKIITTL